MANYSKKPQNQNLLPYWMWQALAPKQPVPLTREENIARWADRQARSKAFRAEVAQAKALRAAEADPTKKDQS